jgi:hypothetical protein
MRLWLLRLLLSTTERRGIRTLWELGCTCGVITSADGKRWDEAQEAIGNLLSALPND